MHESAFLSLILVQIKVKFQGECIFFFPLSTSLSLSPGRGFKGHHFQLKKKKKSQRKIHVNTNVAFHRGEPRAAGVAPTSFIQPERVQHFQHLAGAGLILLSRNGYSKSRTAYMPQSLYKKMLIYRSGKKDYGNNTQNSSNLY